MSTIIKGKNPRKPHTVRYWADGRQRERSFATAGEAKDFRIKVDHDTRAKIFVDDKLGKESFGIAAERWIDRLAVSETSKRSYRSVYRAHVRDVLGGRTVAQVAGDRDAALDLLTSGELGKLGISRRTQVRMII
jgi:hypothetical protein